MDFTIQENRIVELAIINVILVKAQAQIVSHVQPIENLG
jgi:hypothetical protein